MIGAQASRWDLSGKVALVTGASRGLGREIALALAGAGADIVLTSRDVEACELVAAEIEQVGRQALAIGCHVGRWDALDQLVEAAYARFGVVDVLINNAGKSPLYDGLGAITEAYFDTVVNLNLKGPFRLGVLIGERMRAGAGGSIVNVSSAATRRPDPAALPYAAAKAGLNAITVGLARALGPKVRVNAIVAGTFATDVSKHWEPEVRTQLEKQTAAGRIADPQEIAGAALFLASDASSYATGSLLTLDGGLA